MASELANVREPLLNLNFKMAIAPKPSIDSTSFPIWQEIAPIRNNFTKQSGSLWNPREGRNCDILAKRQFTKKYGSFEEGAKSWTKLCQIANQTISRKNVNF